MLNHGIIVARVISPPPIDDLSALRRACELQPDEDVPQQALADCLTEGGEQGERDDVFRHSVAIRRQVGGLVPFIRLPASAVASPGWKPVAAELKDMADHPEDTDTFRTRYDHLVRGDVPLDAEHLEQTLRLQYDLQRGLLTSLNLLEEEDDERFLTAIDGNRYPLPAFEDILERMQTPGMHLKLAQGFDTLLLVPFGLRLEQLLDAWRKGLQRNAATLRGVGRFNEQEPLWVWDGYQREPLVYEPRSFTGNRGGGRTKEEMLAGSGRGWDVLLVEGDLQNLPREGQGQTVGPRRQPECGRAPDVYLCDLLPGEFGLTPEAYIIQFLDALERRGQVLDTETFSYLTGAFLPASRGVPGACWGPGVGRVILYGDVPGYRLADYGARAAVRVR